MADAKKRPTTPAKVQPAKQPTDPSKPGELVGFAAFRGYEGPLPPAEDFASYNQVLPGAAERILAMAERQAAHRISCEKAFNDAEVADIKAERSERRLGQVFGFVIALAGVIVGGLVAWKGQQPWAGGLIAGAGVGSVIGVRRWLHRQPEPPQPETNAKDS